MSEKPALPPAALLPDEANFVYNVEVLGLPVRAAAERAGMPLTKCNAPHIKQAREIAKAEVRGSLSITKEDIVFGMRDAIDRARILSDPATEIVGWEKIARLLGYDQPQKPSVNINVTIDAMNKQIGRMSDEELVQLVGASAVIDGDFYRVP